MHVLMTFSTKTQVPELLDTLGSSAEPTHDHDLDDIASPQGGREVMSDAQLRGVAKRALG